jgi:hypothetical protein
MRQLLQHGCADGIGAAAENALLVLVTAQIQIGVQFRQVGYFWKGHPVVAAEVSAFTLNSALFVASGRVAELALKKPVGTEGDEAAGLFALMPAQDALHHALQVIVAKLLEDAAEIAEDHLMSLKKRLLRCMRKRPMIGAAAGHRAHLEHLQLDALATNQRPGFIPIDLSFHAQL